MIRLRKTRLKALLGPVMIVVTLTALGAVTSSAYGRQLVTHVPSSTFDGTGSTAGPFSQISGVAVDEVRNTVYVVTEQTGIQIDKFDASGNPQAFSSTPGVTSINVGASQTLGGVHIAVDNSAGPTQGRIYVTNDFIPSAIWAFNPDGTPVGGNFPLGAGTTNLAVDPSQERSGSATASRHKSTPTQLTGSQRGTRSRRPIASTGLTSTPAEMCTRDFPSSAQTAASTNTIRPASSSTSFRH